MTKMQGMDESGPLTIEDLQKKKREYGDMVFKETVRSVVTHTTITRKSTHT